MQETKAKNNPLATAGLLIAAASWGLVWYPYRLLQEAGIAGVISTFYTYGVAVLLGLVLFASQFRKMKGMWGMMLAVGLAAGWTNVAYVVAVIHGEVMRVMLLFYLSPLWTLALAYFWLGERTGRLGVIAIATSLLGAFIMLWHPERGMPYPQGESEWLGLFAGIGFAVTNVLTRRAVHLSLAAKSFAVWVGVMLVALLCMPFTDLAIPAPQTLGHYSWLIMAGIGLVLMIATGGVQYGLTHTPATRASVIFLFELVVAALAAYWLAREAMTLREWLGGILIVAASIVAARAEKA
ncbi:MAG TPA: DMT family transporter [Methylophilaceae bacterium]|nr:DMT family transporter [Methylophilaceae bacterium]